jgi:hypothetical protein
LRFFETFKYRSLKIQKTSFMELGSHISILNTNKAEQHVNGQHNNGLNQNDFYNKAFDTRKRAFDPGAYARCSLYMERNFKM